MIVRKSKVTALGIAVIIAAGLLGGCGTAGKNAQVSETNNNGDVPTFYYDDTESTSTKEETKTEETSEETTQETTEEVTYETSEMISEDKQEDAQPDNKPAEDGNSDNRWNNAQQEQDTQYVRYEENVEQTQQQTDPAVNINDQSALLEAAKRNTVNYSQYANKVLNLVNAHRAAEGVPALVLDENLCNAANMRSIEMDYGNYFEHARKDGSSCFSVLGQCGITSFRTCGENIAAGQRSPSEVVESWYNSPGHKANMLNAKFTRMGLGYSDSGNGEYGTYWTQLFFG